MPTFLLIRHGENDFLKQGLHPGQLPGIHLNERGREQAQALADTLKSAPIRAIYSSPLERAVETAEPLARSLGLTIQLRPALLDVNVGEWQGQRNTDLHKLPLWKELKKQPSRVRFPGGESFLELQQRLVGEFDLLLRLHRPKDMLAVVFHLDPIMLVLAHFLGLPLDNFRRFSISPGSVSILAVDRSGGKLLGLNLIPPFTLPG